MKKAIYSLLLVFFLVFGVIASGCISSGTTTKTSATSTATKSGAPEQNVLEIYHWWTAGGEKEAIEAVFKKFKEKYPNIEIKANPVSGGAGVNMKMILQSLILAGKPPDTFQVHAGYEMSPYIKAGQLTPIDDIWTEDMKKHYPQVIQQMVMFNGHYYAVPVNVHRANVIWYNKHIFEKYGIDPNSIKSFDDLIKVAQELKSKGITPFALGDRNKWPATHAFEVIMLSVGGVQFYQDFINGKITDPSNPTLKKVLEAYAEYLNYVNSDHAAKTWDEACGLVYKGDAAMTIMGDWANGYFKAKGWKPNVDYGAIVLPSDVYDLVIDTFVLPTKAAHPETAKKWLSFIGTVEAQNTFNPIKGSIPARNDAPLDPYGPIQKEFIKDLRSSSTKLVPSITHGSAVPPAFLSDLNDIISTFVTNKNVDETAKSIVNAVKQDLLPNKIKEWKLT